MDRLCLFTGSRDATAVMKAKAVEGVYWAFEQRYTILVGDAPGIDETVRLCCEMLYLCPEVWGAHGEIRQPAINPDGEQRHTIPGGYLARDWVMADRCVIGVAVWNGLHHERSGTVYTGRQVEAMGKRVHWYVGPAARYRKMQGASR